MMIPGMLAAVAVPLGFLALVRWLDLYASGSIKGVLICFGWGLVAFLLALQINTFVVRFVGFTLLVTLFAPMIEEVCKSLILVYYVRRPDFTYFVDGAIYGFAAGTCFAVLENLFYLSNAEGAGGLALAFGRAFSTALMHGSATALVGIALGRLRFGRGASRLASLLLGWGAAMTLHITFNNVVNQQAGQLTLLLAIVLGLGAWA
jgi:RsiW-degrading membrane proteinase PrsW (M82 family)